VIVAVDRPGWVPWGARAGRSFATGRGTFTEAADAAPRRRPGQAAAGRSARPPDERGKGPAPGGQAVPWEIEGPARQGATLGAR
jgi:hypothetical protein